MEEVTQFKRIDWTLAGRIKQQEELCKKLYPLLFEEPKEPAIIDNNTNPPGIQPTVE